MNILIANGVNLDLLGQRNPSLYGNKTLEELNNHLRLYSPKEYDLTFFQTNSESEFLEEISKAKYQGLILNPGAWTHTSLALADRLEALSVPKVEIHLSNILSRDESIRHTSLIAKYVDGTIMGFGFQGYELALQSMDFLLSNNNS